MHDGKEGPSLRLAKRVDGIICCIGEVASWLNGVLIAVIILQVILRYVFGRGMVVLEELQWHLYATAFMFGLSYVLTKDSNIRLDILHMRFSPQTKAKIEVLGIILLLIPMILVFFIHSLDFVGNSFRLGERSDAPMGLPYRWLIKSVIPISFFLLFMSAVSRVVRAASVLFSTSREPKRGS